MINVTMRKVFVVAILATILLSILACVGAGAGADGNVYALQLGSTLWGIQSALAEKPSTFIMAKDGLYMFGWALKDSWAFSVLNPDKMTAVEDISSIFYGNKVNAKTMADLVTFLKEKGWELVPASQVPQVIATGASSVSSWLVGLSRSMVSFLVVPIYLKDGINQDDYISWMPEGALAQ